MTNTLHYNNYIVIAIYLIALFVIGFYCSKKQSTSKEYLLGGGKLPFFALGISCMMASLSAFSLVMIPGEIFNYGLSFWVLNLLTPIFTVVTCSVFIKFYLKLKSFTPFEYLEHRYNGSVRSLIAGLTVYLRLIYLGMVLFSTSKVFEGAANWPAWLSILLIGIISITFTCSGGLKAVVWTDVMQFIVLIGGLFCILAFLFIKIDGGVWGAISCAFNNGRGLDEFAKPEFYLLSPYVRLSFWLLLLGQFITPISIMASDQMTIQRLLASGSYKKAMQTQLTNISITIPSILILWLIGLGIFAFYHQNPNLNAQSGDTALFQFISQQLPTPIPGLVIAGMLAAVISTLNATLNSLSTIYVKEFHLRYINKEMDEISQVKLSKIGTVVVGVIATALGLLITSSADHLRQSVVEASTIFNAFDAIIVPAFLFAVLSKRASSILVWVTAGAVWGIKMGMITWFFASRSVVANFEEGMPLGLGGVFSYEYGVYVLLLGALVILLWIFIKYKVVLVLGVAICGYSIALFLWAIFSHAYIKTEPMALSFQWLQLPTVVLYALIGLVWLNFGKVQPKEKYHGLTLFDKS